LTGFNGHQIKKQQKVVLSTTKPKDFYVRPDISLEDKVYP
jgi:hypothetical protein